MTQVLAAALVAGSLTASARPPSWTGAIVEFVEPDLAGGMAGVAAGDRLASGRVQIHDVGDREIRRGSDGPSLASSPWRVQDDATAELMRRFYFHLDAGQPRDDALCQVQIELLSATSFLGLDQDFSAPAYPAAWELVGDWR